jgi:hypothetical protein
MKSLETAQVTEIAQSTEVAQSTEIAQSTESTQFFKGLRRGLETRSTRAFLRAAEIYRSASLRFSDYLFSNEHMATNINWHETSQVYAHEKSHVSGQVKSQVGGQVKSQVGGHEKSHDSGHVKSQVKTYRSFLNGGSIRPRFSEYKKRLVGERRNEELFNERGDVPGWVLVVLMTTGLVTAIWTIAAPRLSTILKNSLDAMNGIR